MQYIIYAPIAGASLIFHFVVYHKRMRLGHSLEAICCVSIAVLAGGVGRYSIGEYMGGAYYVFGLGIGMAIAYVLMKSQFTVKRDYDFKERFAWIMTMVGLLSVAMIAIGYARKFLNLPSNAYAQGFSSNNLCTMLMFALPFPLYLNKKGRLRFT
jgi:hypothetical protein